MLQYFTIDTAIIQRMSMRPLSPRQKDYHEIMWIQEGRARFIIDGEPFSVHANAFFIVPKGRLHQFIPYVDVQGQVIRFTEDFIDDFPRLLFSKFNRMAEVKIDELENNQFDLLFKLIEAEVQLHTMPSLIVAFLLKAVIFKLDAIKQKQFPCSNTLHYDMFDQFQLLLDQHITEQHSVEFYAKKLNITSRKLGEILKSILNKSSTSVILERLLIEAKRRLVYSNHSIQYIAYELGFEDNSYFTKFFKKHSKITPKEFRKTALSVK